MPAYPQFLSFESFPGNVDKGGCTSPFSAVLRDFGPDAHRRYVVHQRNDVDGGFSGGGYHDDLTEARKDYDDRVARYRKVTA